MPENFTWRDGERLIRFGRGVVAEAGSLLERVGFEHFELLAGERTLARGAALSPVATQVRVVPSGRVDELAAGLLAEGAEGPFVALGGGRVVDTAKALAGATGSRCAALPTTLSGAELTAFHRRPAGREDADPARPALVVADPALMASAPLPGLAASAMNALAHAMEALYTPLRGPVTDIAALRAAALLAEGVTREPADGDALALGALLAGYASGATGFAVHHAVCQTLVRAGGSPHAETNAVMLPHTARMMAARAPEPMAALAEALGGSAGDPEGAARRLAPLAARSGHSRLASLGVGADQLPAAVAAVLDHPGLAATPGGPPEEAELLELLHGAL